MSYSHLSLKERFCIHQLYYRKYTLRAIAKLIDRPPSTVSREIKRNKDSKGVYWDEYAHKRAQERSSIARTQKRFSHRPLLDVVMKGIGNKLSPEIISNRLKREYRSEKMRVSHEAIYQWLYLEARQGGHHYKNLVRHHKKRKKQRRSGKRSIIKERVSIHDRPKIVEDKKRFGDWESDSVLGARGQGALATHVERKSKFLVAAKLKDRTSGEYMNATIEAFKSINPLHIKTFTADNGSEFAFFKRLEKATNSRVFFADPYSSWQRGLNENTNGLLRRYFPKGCNFHEISDTLLQEVVDKLNHRPRKCLNYRTAYEVFFKIKSVALGS